MLIALAVGVELQAELLFVDAPRRDVLIARLAFLALAGAVLIRRRAPVVAAALSVGAIGVVGALGGPVNNDLVGPFFVMLFVSYSIGAHAEGRMLHASAAVLVGGSVVAVRTSDPPGGADDIFFALTILAGGPLLLGRLVRAGCGSTRRCTRRRRPSSATGRRARPTRSCRSACGSPASCTTW